MFHFIAIVLFLYRSVFSQPDTPHKRDTRLDAKEREKYKRMRATPRRPEIRDNSVVWINSVDGRTKTSTGAQTGRTPKNHYERIAFGQIFEYIKLYTNDERNCH